MIPRRRGFVMGAVVGGAVASSRANRAQAQQAQMQQQMQMQSELAQAQAEANVAKQQQQKQQQQQAPAGTVYVVQAQPAPQPAPQQQPAQQPQYVPSAIAPPIFLQLRVAHIVDEAALAPHQIISVPQGAIVRLVRGTLEGGLGPPYQDYIEVEYQGRVGKISRLIVVPVSTATSSAAAQLPPPAIS